MKITILYEANMNPQKMTEGRFAGKFELRENNIVKKLAYNPVLVPMQESEKTILVEGREFSCVGVYTFPFTRPNQKNANGRIYTDELWRKVMERGEGEGSPGLMDHPSGDSDGSTKDVWCVWRNIRFNEDRTLVLADAWLVGQWGREVKERLDAGMDIGLSSVGFGDFLRDGVTIDPNSYELDRVADYVLHPSYAVYGTFEGEVRESVSKPAPVGKLTEEILPDLKKESADQGVKPMNARQIRTFALTVENLLERNSTITDLKLRREDVSTIQSYFDEEVQAVMAENKELTGLHAQVKSLAESLDVEVEALYEKGKKLEAFTAEKEALVESMAHKSIALQAEAVDKDAQIAELTESLALATSLAEDLKKTLGNLKEAYLHEKAKTAKAVTKESYNKLRVYAENAKNLLNQKIQENADIQNKLVEATKRADKAQGQIDVLVESYRARDTKLNESKSAEKLALDESAKVEYEAMRAGALPVVREWVDVQLQARPDLKEAHERKLLSFRSIGEAQLAYGKILRGL